jgi:excisionase family DNA binding protein
MDTDQDDLLTVPETAKVLRVQISTIRSWILHRRHLSFVKVGGRVLIRRCDIDAFVTRSIVPATLNPLEP